MTRRGNQTHRRDQRRKDALERQTARDALTNAQQLGLLRDAGHGHCAEAIMLQERIVAEAADVQGLQPSPRKQRKRGKHVR